MWVSSRERGLWWQWWAFCIHSSSVWICFILFYNGHEPLNNGGGELRKKKTEDWIVKIPYKSKNSILTKMNTIIPGFHFRAKKKCLIGSIPTAMGFFLKGNQHITKNFAVTASTLWHHQGDQPHSLMHSSLHDGSASGPSPTCILHTLPGSTLYSTTFISPLPDDPFGQTPPAALALHPARTPAPRNRDSLGNQKQCCSF